MEGPALGLVLISHSLDGPGIRAAAAAQLGEWRIDGLIAHTTQRKQQAVYAASNKLHAASRTAVHYNKGSVQLYITIMAQSKLENISIQGLKETTRLDQLHTLLFYHSILQHLMLHSTC
jgi:hypothetical protein